MRFWVIAFAAAVLCGPLAGCKTLRGINSCNKRQAYQGAGSIPPLKVPSGLDSFDTSGALKLPALNEPEPPRRAVKDPCLDTPPSFKVAAPAPRA